MDPNSIDSTTHVTHGGTTDPTVIDFSANINPNHPPGMKRVYADGFDTIGSYPPEPPQEFIETAATYVNAPRHTVIPTPGGLAAIRLIIESTLTDSDSVLLPYPSFSEYYREIKLQGISPDFTEHDSILSADPTDYSLVIICNPNNPTGTLYDRDELLAFARRCEQTNTLILVDEAFLGFTDQPSLSGTPNVLVARSLTKLFGIPGLRVGFVVAPEPHADQIRSARRTWNLSAPAIAVGTYAMKQTDFIKKTRSLIAQQRSHVFTQLEPTFAVHPSHAPFLLLDTSPHSVDTLLEKCKRNGILVRDARSFRGLNSHIRIAIRGEAENKRLVNALTDV